MAASFGDVKTHTQPMTTGLSRVGIPPRMIESRRNFISSTTKTIAISSLAAMAQAQESNRVQLSQIHATDEKPETTPTLEEPDKQIGYAIVGLGRLSLNQILPAFGRSKRSKPVALVSGDRDKAKKIASQYGIRDSAIYDYKTYDNLADNPEVQAIYIVLPNSMHAEFVIRGAKAKKHILCEKPMATSVEDCEKMIAACAAANVKLMIAYRQQYEPNNRAASRLLSEGKLGAPKQFIATNSQDQGDPTQWRLNRSLAGGGSMPDVGIYCLNAVRFLSKEEPIEVIASLYQPTSDERFKEVEASCQFIARFPSGLTAICNSGYNAHKSQVYRIECERGFAEMNPAFGYVGNKLSWTQLVDGADTKTQPSIGDKDQFALEMDHFSLCIQQNLQPHTPGEEGLQDQKIVAAIYESARTGKPVKLSVPQKPTRGPEPKQEE
ncbi:MAG TPA: Gfo/Idh/MocA family oxidoreductase [Edaphobacter sp.]|nr:Gfo/Idh/MocA family oxidoreductase [Edaphobacter sp.]